MREAKQPWQMRIAEFVQLSNYYRDYRSNYFTEDGRQIGSSRLLPARPIEIQIGAWLIDDGFKGLHGREIEQLRLLDPAELEPSEDPKARRDDVERYYGWLQDGLTPPPIWVVESERGTLRITDGHRRWAASLRAGVQVPAWVSPIAELEDRDCLGQPIKTGLTHELSIRQALARGETLPRGLYIDYPDLACTVMDYHYGVSAGM